MAGRERRVGAVVSGIEFDRLLEQRDGFEGVRLGFPAQVRPSLEQGIRRADPSSPPAATLACSSPVSSTAMAATICPMTLSWNANMSPNGPS